MKNTRFTVAGTATSDAEMLICIPMRYKNLFEGHSFKDAHELSMALMHATCAAEAWHNNRLLKVTRYEADLKAVLAG